MGPEHRSLRHNGSPQAHRGRRVRRDLHAKCEFAAFDLPGAGDLAVHGVHGGLQKRNPEENEGVAVPGPSIRNKRSNGTECAPASPTSEISISPIESLRWRSHNITATVLRQAMVLRFPQATNQVFRRFVPVAARKRILSGPAPDMLLYLSRRISVRACIRPSSCYLPGAIFIEFIAR